MSLSCGICARACAERCVSSSRAGCRLSVSTVPAADGRWCIGDIIWSQSVQSDAGIWWHLRWVLFAHFVSDSCIVQAQEHLFVL